MFFGFLPSSSTVEQLRQNRFIDPGYTKNPLSFESGFCYSLTEFEHDFGFALYPCCNIAHRANYESRFAKYKKAPLLGASLELVM